jgi:uncharacterized protein YjdB
MQARPAAARASGLIGALVLSGLFLSCGARSGPILTQITVTPANQVIAKGATLKFSALGTFSDKTEQALTDPVTWQTSQPDVATITSEGDVTGVAEGVVTVLATYQGVTGSASVTVGPPALISITVSPAQSSLPVGESERLTATGNLSDGTVQNLTQSATWSSSQLAIASVSTMGAALANGVGTATITATSGSVTGSASLTVAPPVVIALNILPPTLFIALGNSRQLQAMVTLSSGTTQAITSATWQTSQSAVATVNVQGNVTGMGQGVAQVSAAYQGMTASTTVTVGPPALVSISVAPNQSSLPLGESEQLVATGNFSNGTVQKLIQSATWSSSGSTIASVSAAGNVVANATGAVTITATSGSVTGSANVTVAPPAVTALNISPPAVSIALGNSRQLQAMATMSNGTTQAINSATWQTSQSAIAAVNAQGNVTGMGQGAAQVSAAYQGMTASTTVAVGPPALVSVTVAPNPSSLPVGESEQLTATGNFSNGTVQNLTQSATWSSSAAIASVSSAGNVIASATGAVTISATSGSVTGSANVTVSPPAVTALNIIPATLSIVLGGNFQLQAMATLSDGTTQNMTGTAAWSALEPAIASVGTGGLVSSWQLGSATIQAQSNGLTASASITVIPLMGVSYFSRIASQNSGMDGTVELINPGLTTGTLCAMVYVFDQNQELNECCGCSISDDGMRTLSLLNDLTGNTLTGKKPRAGSIQIVSSDPGPNPQCNPSSLAPLGEIVGSETNVQSAGGGNYQITETQLDMVPMSAAQETMLANECGVLQQLGSGSGICTCGTGGQ